MKSINLRPFVYVLIFLLGGYLAMTNHADNHQLKLFENSDKLYEVRLMKIVENLQ